MSSLITAQMQAALGTRLGHQVSYPVSASDIRRWATAIYWPEPPPEKYLSAEEAWLTAPEDMNPFAWAVLSSDTPPHPSDVPGHDPDRTEKSIGIEGPGLTKQLNGGLKIEYGVPMRVGDTISSERILAGYTEREGRLGRMLFTTMTDTWTNQENQTVKRTELTLIRY